MTSTFAEPFLSEVDGYCPFDAGRFRRSTG
jgi:hypothetical protein